MSLAAAVKARRKLARAGGRLVLTNGVFDLLHPGHTSYLAAARRLAGPKGALFVALNSDRNSRASPARSSPRGTARTTLPSWPRWTASSFFATSA